MIVDQIHLQFCIPTLITNLEEELNYHLKAKYPIPNGLIRLKWKFKIWDVIFHLRDSQQAFTAMFH